MQDSRPIKLLTYNLLCRPIINNMQSDKKDERLEEFMKVMVNFDVLCLQEIFDTWNNTRRERLITAA